MNIIIVSLLSIKNITFQWLNENKDGYKNGSKAVSTDGELKVSVYGATNYVPIYPSYSVILILPLDL